MTPEQNQQIQSDMKELRRVFIEDLSALLWHEMRHGSHYGDAGFGLDLHKVLDAWIAVLDKHLPQALYHPIRNTE